MASSCPHLGVHHPGLDERRIGGDGCPRLGLQLRDSRLPARNSTITVTGGPDPATLHCLVCYATIMRGVVCRSG